jgi:hypothetical protein
MDEKKLVEYLGAPCMTSVTILDWSTRDQVSKGGYLETSLTELSILPNLRAISYVKGDFSDLLLRYRPIQKVRASEYETSNAPEYADLMKRGGELTHISLECYLDAQAVIDAIVADPLPFRNLQHLGTFYLLANSRMVRITVDPLIGLTVFKESME